MEGAIFDAYSHVAFYRRIAARFNRTKAVVPRRIRCQTHKSFEIGIERRRVDITRMTVFPRRVGLPDVDARMRHRRSRTGEALRQRQLI
jgi:hypothetical protein